MAGLVGQRLVGTLSIYEEASQVARLTAFAIDTNYQHRGYGQQLVRYVLADLAQQDYREVRVNARATAKGFYEICGFCAVGERVYNGALGIEDYRMVYQV